MGVTIDSTEPPADLLNLESVFYWELPQLDAAEASSLAKAVYPEVESRVGRRLSARCTATELEEIGALIDDGDDARCSRWLDEHVPEHPAITVAETEALIAETVAKVDQGDAGGDDGPSYRRTRRIERVDLRLLERVLDFRHREYDRDGDALVFLHEWGAQRAPFRLRMAGSAVCLQSTHPSEFPKRRHPELLTFAHRWNVGQYLPKAYTVGDLDGSAYTVVAEVVLPVAPGIHGQLIDHVVGTGIDATCRMFDALTEAAAEWEPTLF